MEELSELRASVAAHAWNGRASELLTAVSAARAAAVGARLQQQPAQSGQQPQQHQQHMQPPGGAAAAVSAASSVAHASVTAPPFANSSPRPDAVADEGLAAPLAQQVPAPAGSAPDADQQGQGQQLSLWERIAAAEAAAAEAAERAEAELSVAAAADAAYRNLVSMDRQQVKLLFGFCFSRAIRHWDGQCLRWVLIADSFSCCALEKCMIGVHVCHSLCPDNPCNDT